VYKLGSGSPSLVASQAYGTPRGVDVNKNPASPYFGRVYLANGGADGLYLHNSDLSQINTSSRKAGVAWQATSSAGTSPYRIAVASDDYLMVGDASATGAAVWRIDPNALTSALFLGPVGETAGLGPTAVHGSIQSRPLLIGTTTAGNALLYQVDGNLSAGNGFNSLRGYYVGSGPLPWQNVPDTNGPEIGIGLSAESLGGNEYPGLVLGPGGYIYASTYRLDLSRPDVQIYNTNTLAQVWNSQYNGGTADYFVTAAAGGGTSGVADCAVSADGRFIATCGLDNHFTIASLTNGIPNVASLYTVTPTSFTGNARGICWDAADNLYLSSSGIGAVQAWTLGLTATAITTGNASGSTGFQLVFPGTSIQVVAVTNFASQNYGAPIPGVFTITRTNVNNDYSFPITVNITLTGTATNGVYTCLPASLTPAAPNTITIAAGQTSTNITIIPITNNVPRLATTVVCSVNGSAGYSTAFPPSDAVTIQNTAEPQLVLSAGASTAYKRFTNDYASVTITRMGNTNVTLSVSTFTFGGTAVKNTDYAVLPVTIPAGTVTMAAPIFNPLNPPEPVWVGDKTVTVTLGANNPTYTNMPGSASQTLTILDDKNPAAPVLWSDPLTNSLGGVNGNNDGSGQWNLTAVSRDGNPTDSTYYNVNWGYDLVGDPSGYGHIPLPLNGFSHALRATYNKVHGVSGAVNLYPTNVTFSGDYAVRFQMCAAEGGENGGVGKGTVTEGPMFGINHDGMETNWWAGSTPVVGGPWSGDGVWYWLDADPGGATSSPASRRAAPISPARRLPSQFRRMERPATSGSKTRRTPLSGRPIQFCH
jgi:hypothetical protein